LEQIRVEFVEVAHLRDRHEEVQPRKLHAALDHSFLVGPPHPTEMVRKQVMTLELQEPRGELARPSRPDDLRHCDARVVVADPPRYAPEELERLHVTFPKRL